MDILREIDKFLAEVERNKLTLESALNGKSEDTLQKWIQEKNYCFLKYCAGMGEVDVCKFLLKLISDEEKKEDRFKVAKYNAFIWSAENGHKEILELLLDEDIKERLIKECDNTNKKRADQLAQEGYCELGLRKLKEKHYWIGRDKPINLAAQNGHLEVVDMLLDIYPNEEIRKKAIHADEDKLLKLAIKNHHFELADYLICQDHIYPWKKIIYSVEMLTDITTPQLKDYIKHLQPLYNLAMVCKNFLNKEKRGKLSTLPNEVLFHLCTFITGKKPREVEKIIKILSYPTSNNKANNEYSSKPISYNNTLNTRHNKSTSPTKTEWRERNSQESLNSRASDKIVNTGKE